jgi:hypothetical protein
MRLKEVYVVVDALDECAEANRPALIRLLGNIAKDILCAKVFVTSRNEGDTECTFAESSTPTI